MRRPESTIELGILRKGRQNNKTMKTHGDHKFHPRVTILPNGQLIQQETETLNKEHKYAINNKNTIETHISDRDGNCNIKPTADRTSYN